jgi:hypothetical protein
MKADYLGSKAEGKQQFISSIFSIEEKLLVLTTITDNAFQ